MVVYTLDQRWEVDLRSTLPKKKKNHLFRWSSFWFWRVCKQAKLSHLGHRKPSRIHWNPPHPKRVTVWCGFWASKMSKENEWIFIHNAEKWACHRLTEDTGFGKKKIIFSSEVYLELDGYVNKKIEYIHWKADAPKTSHCLVRILVQTYNWAIFIQK